jgi:pilus assembly protein Flp/PilA
MNWLSAKLRKEDGANLVEYILLVSFIAVIVMAAVAFLGSELDGSFDNAGSTLSATPNP